MTVWCSTNSYDHTDIDSINQPIRGGGVNSSGPKAPTLEECEAIIQELHKKSRQQAHELLQIKADLRDVLYSHKWTPDAFLMARAYVSRDNPQQAQGYGLRATKLAKYLVHASSMC